MEASSAHGTQILISDGGANDGVKASLTKGTGDSKIVFQRKVHGTAGNGKTITIVESGNNTPLTVVVADASITVNLETDGSGNSVSTVNDVIAALYADSTFQTYWDATNGDGDGTGVLAAAAADVTAGGTNGTAVYTEIPGVFNGPNGPSLDPEVIERKVHSQTARIRKPTGVNIGAVTFDITWDSSNTQHALLYTNARAQTKTDFREAIQETGEQVMQYSAYIGLNFSAPPEDLTVVSVTLNIDGDITDL